MTQLPFALHVKIKCNNSRVTPRPPCFQKQQAEEYLTHPIFVTHALPCRLLVWKRLVNYDIGQEPKLTPRTSQENSPASPWPLPANSNTQEPGLKSLSGRVGALVASSPLQDIRLNTYWTKLEMSVYGSPLEDDETKSSSRRNAFGNVTRKMHLELGADIGNKRCVLTTLAPGAGGVSPNQKPWQWVLWCWILEPTPWGQHVLIP